MPFSTPVPFWPLAPERGRGVAALLVCLWLGTGCVPSQTLSSAKPSVYMNERFQGDETFSRLLDGSPEQACEASRRALLSQGYVIGFSEAGTVKATKRFQPDGDSHIEIVFNVVCVSDSKGGQVSTAYVSALQETYTIKKSQNSANIGVSALGSISVPLPASRESLVKVGSETIPAGEFYDRFFALTQRLLREMVSAQEG